ncbi:permease-like cell division protein FtsX [Microtetraspora fusca]|uniref:Permease-like cell division protein FtsX n=1 Tax=Microtetraspora fusca TaxID=1997 RepID=A0ABW6UY81_MICFU|nr:permease-like cell division protein FtsX [Microtetraspora fusca]
MIEQRLREALSEAAATADLRSVRPLTAPRGRARSTRISRFVVIPAALVAAVSVGVFLLVRPAPPATTAGNPMADSLAQLGLAEADSWKYEIAVFLCKKNGPYPVCKKRAATEDDRRRIKQVLESMPEVGWIQFESRAEAYKKFRATNSDNLLLVQVVKPSDLPESFRVKVLPGADRKAVLRAVEHMPGVSNVVDTVCIVDKARC